MPDKMECDWFKSSKHEVNYKPNKKPTKIIVFSMVENKFKMKNVSNTVINKLKW